MNTISKCILILFLFLLPSLSNAQISETQSEKEARLKLELIDVENQIIQNEKILKDTQNQSSSLKRDILILETKIKTAQLNIKAKNLIIETLGKDINIKQNKIESLDQRIEKGRETLSQIMRKTNEIDSVTLPEFILATENLSTFFVDIDTFESIQESLKKIFEEIRDDKNQTESEKNILSDKKNKEQDARTAIESEKKNIENNEKEKQRLLAISKGNEATYSQILASKKAKAAEIRAALFSLAGGSQAIPFELALKYANEASRATGIRPAFLLAIFAQESGLSQDSTFGKQVGTCYLTNLKTGAGASVKTGTIFEKVMPPGQPYSTRDDITPFIRITKALGLDYSKTLVSCPQSVGWGGAMGPAQFIPTTWALYENGIKKALNISTTNPWNPEHAFVAASLLLIDNGAISGSYTSEKNAACKYYSGKACNVKSINNTYGTSVMAKADNIQRNMIDPLQGL